MIKAIIFDFDGVINISPLKFTQQVEKNFGVKSEITLEFFKNEFQDCLVGTKDLKTEIQKYLNMLGRTYSVEDIINFWFDGENNLDINMIDIIGKLKANKINCYLATNNEKYRTEYIKNNMGIDKILDKVYSSCYIGYEKPDLEYYQYVYDDINKYEKINNDEIMFFDDKQENVDAGNCFGFNSYLYLNIDQFKNTLKSNGINI